MNVLAFTLITVAMISGLIGAPVWLAIASGLGLATIAIMERRHGWGVGSAATSQRAICLTNLKSVGLGLMVSLGSYAMGTVFSTIFV